MSSKRARSVRAAAAIAGALLLVLAGCDRPPPGALASWGDRVVGAADLDAHVAALPDSAKRPVEGDALEEWLRERLRALAAERVTHERAVAAGLPDEPALRTRARAAANLEVGYRWVQQACPLTEPDEAELRAVYDAETRGGATEWILLRHVFKRKPPGASAEAAAAVRAEMESILEDLESGASFPDLARRHSESETAEGGGLIGRVSRQGPMDPRFLEAAWALDDGEVSDVVELDNGFHIIRREDFGVQSPPDFETLRPRLRNQVARNRQEACGRRLLDELARATPARLADEGLPMDPEPDDVLLHVGDEAFTVAQLDGLAPGGARLGDLPNVLGALRQFVESELLARAARAADPEVEARWQTVHDEALRGEVVAAQWQRERRDWVAALPAEELRAFFDENRDLFRHEVTVDLGVVVLAVDGDRSEPETAALARRLADRLAAGESFEAVAREHSEHPSAGQGGRIGRFPWSRVRTLFGQEGSEAIGKLEPGEVTDPFLLSRQPLRTYGLVRLYERLPPSSIDFEEALESGRLVEQYADHKVASVDESLRSDLLDSVGFALHDAAVAAYARSMAGDGSQG